MDEPGRLIPQVDGDGVRFRLHPAPPRGVHDARLAVDVVGRRRQAGLPFLEATREIFAAAGKMGAALRKKGITMPLSDLLIASPWPRPMP